MSAASQQQPVNAWLTTREFIALSGYSLRTLWNKVGSGELPSRKDGKLTRISAAALPEAARTKLAPMPASNKEMRPAMPSPASAPLFANVEQRGPGRRIVLSAEAERQAQQRLKVLRPLLDFCDDPDARARMRGLRLATGQPVRNAKDAAAYLVQAHSGSGMKLSVATLWRWKASYEKHGLVGLARKVREDKGRAKWAEQCPAAAELVTATYLQHNASKMRAYDALTREATRLGMVTVPSYASVCDYLATLPAPAVVMAREGQRAYKERMSPYLSRGYTDFAPNDIWVADTMLHDVLVRDDCFNQDNAAVRTQLTAIMDMRSRKLVGYCWVLNGSSRSITTALMRAVRAYGPCKVFYCDNGKDFQKVGRFATPAAHNEQVTHDVQQLERSGALRRLGIEVQFCTPYHPQAKNIERFFGTLHRRLDANFRHYTGGNSDQRPDVTAEAAATHSKVLRMTVQQPELVPQYSPLMAASDFIRMAETWIEQDYNALHKHSGKGMNGQTPDAVFNAGYPLDARRVYDLSVLDTLLWKSERRKVRECSVTVNNRRLLGVGPIDHETMHLANETEVIVCFDPNAPETGVVTDLDGRKLCDVRAEVFAPHSAAAAPMIAASMQQRRGLRNATAHSIRGLQSRVVRSGHRTEIELLYEKSLPVRVEDSVVMPIAQKATGTYGAAKQIHSEDIGDDLAARLAGGRHGA